MDEDRTLNRDGPRSGRADRLVVAIVALGLTAGSFVLLASAFQSEGAPPPRPGSTGGPTDSPESEPSDRPEPSPPPEDWRFIPPTRTEGGLEIVAVTFPDGSTAELAYPTSLGLAGLGVTPYIAGCGHDFGFTHYDPRDVKYYGEPLEVYEGVDGRDVGLYKSVKGWGGSDFLMFHFGAWWVDLYQYRHERSMPEGRKDCAENLRGTVTDDGWIVLSGPPDLGLNGAELWIGSLGPERRIQIILFPGRCENDATPDATLIGGLKGFADWCDPSGVRIHVYFEAGSTFFDDVFEDLEIRDVRFAS
jgi:hypothetical protein